MRTAVTPIPQAIIESIAALGPALLIAGRSIFDSGAITFIVVALKIDIFATHKSKKIDVHSSNFIKLWGRE